MSSRILRAESEEQWLEWAVHGFLRAAVAAEEERGAFHVVMAGGSTPRAVLERLAVLSTLPSSLRAAGGSVGARGDLSRIWRHTHVYFSDERGVPPDDPASNYRMVREAWLDPASIPGANVHRIEGELELETAARAYNDELAKRLGPAPPANSPFDLVVLGLGPDGHAASLIPGRPLDLVAEPWAGVGPAPLSPANVRRVSMTGAALRSTLATTFWVRGESKAEVVRAAITGEGMETVVPDLTRGVPDVTWMLDSGSASRLALS